MSRTFVRPGDTITYVNAGSAIAAGAIVVMGTALIGIALVDIASGESGEVAISGVHQVTKVAGTAWVLGDLISWDASAPGFEKGPTPASGDVIGCATAHEAAGSSATTGLVRLNPGTGAYEA